MARRKFHCGLCGKTRQGTFCGLPKGPRSHLNETKTIHVYQPGEALFFEGNPPFALYCLHIGLIKLYKTNEGGRRQVIRLLGPGEVLGYRAILANEPYAATAVAVEKSSACLIPRQTLFELFRLTPSFAVEMMAKLAIELRLSEEQLMSLLYDSARQRAARLLLSLADRRGDQRRTGSIEVTGLRRNEMAQVIGISPETFSRVLRRFAEDGIIQLSRSEITIKSVPRLVKITSRS